MSRTIQMKRNWKEEAPYEIDRIETENYVS